MRWHAQRCKFVAQDELIDQMDISGSLEDLQDQNVIVYLLRVFRDKYYSKACAMSTSACFCVNANGPDTQSQAAAPALLCAGHVRLPDLLQPYCGFQYGVE
jgi:hypothetical protein